MALARFRRVLCVAIIFLRIVLILTATHKKTHQKKTKKQNQKITKTMPIICIDGRTCQNEIKFKIYLLIFINFKHSLTGLKHIF